MWVNNHRYIVWKYLTSWFLLDFISIFPFQEGFKWYSQLGFSTWVSVVPFHLFGVVKLLRFANPRMMDRIMSLFPRGISNQHKSLAKFFGLLLCLIHWVACSYCLIAQLEKRYRGAESGDDEDSNEPFTWQDSDTLTTASIYLHAVEFSICAMVLTYAPRSTPQTLPETLFAIFSMLIMGCVYAYAIGAVCGILATMDPASTEYRTKRDLIRSWTKEMEAAPELRAQLFEYIEQCRPIIRQEYYHQLLQLLSPKLRARLSQHEHGGWLQRVAFFQCDDVRERRRFLLAVANEVKPAVYARGEVITQSGDPADRMYVISKGVVALSSGNIMSVKRYFGEEMILRHGTMCHTVNAVVFVTCNVLFKTDLVEILSSGRFPRTWACLRKWIIRRTFQRHVLMLVYIRKAAGMMAPPLSKAEFKKEKQRLIALGSSRRRALLKQNRLRSGAHKQSRRVSVTDTELQAGGQFHACHTVSHCNRAPYARLVRCRPRAGYPCANRRSPRAGGSRPARVYTLRDSRFCAGRGEEIPRGSVRRGEHRDFETELRGFRECVSGECNSPPWYDKTILCHWLREKGYA